MRTDNEAFEQWLKDKTDDYRIYPSDNSWKKIQRKLHVLPFLKRAFGTLTLMAVLGGGYWWAADQALDKSTSTTSSLNGRWPLAQTSLGENNKQVPAITAFNNAKINTPTQVEKNTLPLKNGSIPFSEKKHGIIIASSQIDEVAQPTTDLDEIAPIEGLDNPVPTMPIISTSTQITAVDLSIASTLPKATAPNNAPELLPSKNEPEATVIHSQKSKPSKAIQFYFTPTVSYRIWNDGLAGKRNANGTLSTGNLNNPIPAADDWVKHKPAFGFDLGAAYQWPISNRVGLRAGLQMALNRYQVQATPVIPVATTIPISANGLTRSMPVQSGYATFSSYRSTWLNNFFLQFAVPIGLQAKLAGNQKLAWYAGLTIQPTLLLNNQAYLLSTDLRNYAQANTLTRRGNIHGSIETYLTIPSANPRNQWQFGPQIRYQVLSSYKSTYPIKENLLDYGFKIGFLRNLK